MMKYNFYAVATFFLEVVMASEQFPVSKQCMSCICEAISSCDTSYINCTETVCGPFRMTWPYWSEGGKLTINGESPEAPKAFQNCALDMYCSSLAVQGYMRTSRTDCNGDGRVDCDDFARIHKLGPVGCKVDEIRGSFKRSYEACKAIVGATDSDNKV